MRGGPRGPSKKARTRAYLRRVRLGFRGTVTQSRKRKSNCKCDQCRGPNPYRREEIRRGGLWVE